MEFSYDLKGKKIFRGECEIRKTIARYFFRNLVMIEVFFLRENVKGQMTIR